MIPYVAFGNEELEKCAKITEEGMEIICPHCGQLHKIEYGKNAKTGEKTNSLSFYKCPTTKKTYLAGVDGRLIMGLKGNRSGNV